MSNTYKSGEDFLNRKYKKLFFSDIVESIKDNSNTRDEAIKKYLKLLEETHNNVYSSKRESDRNLLKRLYYSKYIIKEEDITDNYWNFLNQKNINEKGYELNEILKREHVQTIIKDQKASLDVWIDYLSCEDSKFYPTWAKYWAFQGMLTIGTFDKKNQIYKKRTKDTVAPFIELNHEVLAKCIDYIVKYIEYNQVEEKELEQIITSGNFFKLYTTLLTKFKETSYEKYNINGIWKKYEMGDNYQELYNSLQGYGTGWCTAGEESCREQVRDGDFYVYYTYDKNGNPVIPRIAIRMDGTHLIAEIRGVSKDQNLESNLELVLEEKLKEFPDRNKYKQRLEDQKMLTFIYNKYKQNIKLTKEELEFIYELKRKIKQFGYQDDHRKKEILSSRNKKKDYAFIFDCLEEEIALSLSEYEAKPSKYKILISDIFINDIGCIKELLLPQIVVGDLFLNGYKDTKYFMLPQILFGNLHLDGLISTERLVLPQTIEGYLTIGKIKSSEGLELPENFDLDKLYCSNQIKQELMEKKKKKTK